MISGLFQLFALVPILTVALVVLAAWLVRRRPGRIRHGWLVAFGALLVAADEVAKPEEELLRGRGEAGLAPSSTRTRDDVEVELPEPAPSAWGTAEEAHHTVEFGGGAGSFQTCSGARLYGAGGAMYRYTTPISEQTNVTVAGGGYVAGAGTFSGGVRGSVGLEHRWIGGSLGVLAGRIHRESTMDDTIFPTASLRLGPRDMVFLDANFLDASPAPVPGPLIELGAGVAFPALGNRWEPLRFRAGVSGSGVYLAPTIPIGDLGNVEVLGAYGDPATWGVSARMRLHFDAAP